MPAVAKRRRLEWTSVSVRVVSIALLVSVLWLLGSTGQAYACSCAEPGSPVEALETSGAVFAGRVVSVEGGFDPAKVPYSAEDRTTVEFEVGAVWKGVVHERMYVTTRPDGASCGFAFVEGEEYVVYAHDSAEVDGGYGVYRCSRTALLSQAQADIDGLGAGDAPQAGTGGPAPGQSPDTAAGGVWAILLRLVAAVAQWLGWWCGPL
ncbi:MAG: hypothetical protein OXI03_10990 [Chloroflexota bacterium]|nr:hypothetical protein [Chloroflexota bacterium]